MKWSAHNVRSYCNIWFVKLLWAITLPIACRVLLPTDEQHRIHRGILCNATSLDSTTFWIKPHAFIDKASARCYSLSTQSLRSLAFLNARGRSLSQNERNLWGRQVRIGSLDSAAPPIGFSYLPMVYWCWCYSHKCPSLMSACSA